MVKEGREGGEYVPFLVTVESVKETVVTLLEQRSGTFSVCEDGKIHVVHVYGAVVYGTMTLFCLSSSSSEC